jgi:hypothetical protein
MALLKCWQHCHCHSDDSFCGDQERDFSRIFAVKLFSQCELYRSAGALEVARHDPCVRLEFTSFVLSLSRGKTSMFTTSILLVAGCLVMATSIFTAARPLRMVSPY